MEDIDSAIMLKEKLLTAGIDEILIHGMGDFSLRRVAAAAEPAARLLTNILKIKKNL